MLVRRDQDHHPHFAMYARLHHDHPHFVISKITQVLAFRPHVGEREPHTAPMQEHTVSIDYVVPARPDPDIDPDDYHPCHELQEEHQNLLVGKLPDPNQQFIPRAACMGWDHVRT